MRRFWTRACFIIGAGASISLSDAARATSVTISRMGAGTVCNGWAVDANTVVTAAHCVSEPGHYIISAGTKVYQALRAWIHPEYSPELLFHSSLGKHELNYDLALLRIIQKDFVAGGEKIDQLNGRGLPPASTLYAVRPPNRKDSGRRHTEDIEYVNLQYKDNGIVISNAGKRYQICPGDSGTPLYAKIDDERTIVGVIVGYGTQGKMPREECGNEIYVITASVVLRFIEFVDRAYIAGDRPGMPR
jgi:secreted trypsin-like serine protease